MSSNEPSEEAGKVRVSGDHQERSPFEELFRLQVDFQARLAEETLKYVRKLQGALSPAAPGTVVMADESVELRGSGSPGSTIELPLEVENLQRVHCVVTPFLAPLVDASGTTWFPDATASPVSLLLAPDDKGSLVVEVVLPKDLPPATYRGTLLLQGFQDPGLPVQIRVTATRRRTPATASSRRGRSARS